MAHRIKAVSKVPDTRASVRKQSIRSLNLNGYIDELWIADVYTMTVDASDELMGHIQESLTNPVVHTVARYTDITAVQDRIKALEHLEPLHDGFSWAVEIGFLPGVTDNVGSTARETVEQLSRKQLAQHERVYFSQMTYLKGDLSPDDIERVSEHMANKLIQRVRIKSYEQYVREGGMNIDIPSVNLSHKTATLEVELNVSDEELIKLGKQGIRNPNGTRRGPLALDLQSMKAIQSYYKKLRRNPTDIELEAIAQTWSEHCKHTIFTAPIDELSEGLYKSYIRRATEEIRAKKGTKDRCVSVFSDNAGAVLFDAKHLVTHKVETHNSPSALDPFGGSVTGIVGVNRDALGFGLGAKPVINTYGFCFADPSITTPLYRDKTCNDKVLAPKRIMEGVIEGVNAGGNCSGIPTPQGFIYFDDGYRAKPLVFVGTVGLIPRIVNGKKSHKKKAKSGDYIVMIGGRVGLDGIHGATFSSESLNSGSPVTAVQIGDPITQKKLSDALIKEARDAGLYSSITDNGAGGLSCSVAEMARESGGCFVYLDKIPLKYSGLDPWQIWISESQERMTLAVPKNKWPQLAELMRRRGVEATIIGLFTDSGTCIVEHSGHRVVNLQMNFLHEGFPKKKLRSAYKQIHHKEPVIKQSANLSYTLHRMLKRLNIAGYEFISMQYDHEVQGGSVTKPLQGRGRVNADATITKPVLESKKGVVLSQALYPRYGEISMYDMAACSIDTAIRAVVAAGGDVETVALLDNICWCSPQLTQRLGELKETVRACYEYAVAYGTPFISGKDSMYNDFNGFDSDGKRISISIPPTLLISSIGVIPDVRNALTIDAKIPGDLVYVLGETREELGGSEFFALHNAVGNAVPKVDATQNKKMYLSFGKAVHRNLIASAISVGRGGLGVALAKTAMSGLLGMNISLAGLSRNAMRDDFLLFSESQGRLLVTIDPRNREEFEKVVLSVPHVCIGSVTKQQRLKIQGSREAPLIDEEVGMLLQSYKLPFHSYVV